MVVVVMIVVVVMEVGVMVVEVVLRHGGGEGGCWRRIRSGCGKGQRFVGIEARDGEGRRVGRVVRHFYFVDLFDLDLIIQCTTTMRSLSCRQNDDSRKHYRAFLAF